MMIMSIQEILSAGLREIGGYLDHFTDDSGRMKVLLKRTILLEETPSDERITVQVIDWIFAVISVFSSGRRS